MNIRIGYDIEFELPGSREVTFALFIHPSRAAAIRKQDGLQIVPSVPYETFRDGFGNVCGRACLPAGSVRFLYDAVVEDSGEPDPINVSARQHKVRDLPPEALQFLLASRYCEVDSELGALAWSRFGAIEPGWKRVQAVCDYVHGHLTFDYQRARATRTAMEAWLEQTGVCRDFTHLAITLCRCLGIPARYATGYLGDIGLPAVPDPMDFSAWLEVYLDNRWWTFDARHNQRRIGRVLMATRRDAADVALTTIFGQNRLTKFVVWTDEVKTPPAFHLNSPTAHRGSHSGSVRAARLLVHN